MTDAVAEAFLEEYKFKRLGAMEAQVVIVDEGAKFRRDVNVNARVVERQTGVDEIGLPLKFAAAQGGNQTVRPDQLRAGLRQTDLLRIPEADFAAGEIRMIHDRVEAARRVVIHIRVTRTEKARDAVTNPVEIHRNFGGGHLRVDALGASGYRVVRVAPDRLIERVGDVQPPEMPVAVHAEISRLDAMRLAAEADARRAHAQSVIVLFGGRLVRVVERAELERVALDEGVLAKEVGDVDLLVAHIDFGEIDRV